MTNSNSLARAKHAAKHETTAQARQAAAAKKKDYDKTADSLERGRSLVRERQAAVEGLNAAEAALVGPDYLPSPPEREARRDAEDALAVAHRMVRVLEATVADAAKEFEAAALTAGACEKELESTALPVIEEEGQRLIAQWREARVKTINAEKLVRSMLNALTAEQHFAVAERLSVAFREGVSQSREYVIDAAPFLNFFARLKSDADAELSL